MLLQTNYEPITNEIQSISKQVCIFILVRVMVIFEKDLSNFSYDPGVFLKEKSFCITGIIKMYNGKPEIIATKEEQIAIQ